jgi:hypothetical protein
LLSPAPSLSLPTLCPPFVFHVFSSQRPRETRVTCQGRCVDSGGKQHALDQLASHQVCVCRSGAS